MSKMIQIRHVPDALHRKLKERATGAGMSLSDYLRRELEQVAEYPSWEEFLNLVSPAGPTWTGESAVEAVHAARAERDEELGRVLGVDVREDGDRR